MVQIEAKSPTERYQELPLFTFRDKLFVSLNQPVLGSSPRRLTLDTELSWNDVGHITRQLTFPASITLQLFLVAQCSR